MSDGGRCPEKTVKKTMDGNTAGLRRGSLSSAPQGTSPRWAAGGGSPAALLKALGTVLFTGLGSGGINWIAVGLFGMHQSSLQEEEHWIWSWAGFTLEHVPLL